MCRTLFLTAPPWPGTLQTGPKTKTKKKQSKPTERPHSPFLSALGPRGSYREVVQLQNAAQFPTMGGPPVMSHSAQEEQFLQAFLTTTGSFMCLHNKATLQQALRTRSHREAVHRDPSLCVSVPLWLCCSAFPHIAGSP